MGMTDYKPACWKACAPALLCLLHFMKLLCKETPGGNRLSCISFAGMQKLLAQAFDHRPMRRFITRSTANLQPQVWQDEVSAFMHGKGKPEAFYVEGL
ncbi:UNKNOWN [Stylonychia lemnae]|uniref:Uncharacterized protein n=1 Tax=Stylonychia lemnae TaxID=5949 RepID=A0A078AWL8_STYLE|nr:UNKNOWN [Stylonychia lemnae]|eukprot:CDW86554.1 UNKNOWN [Stylonychia lemnae]